MYQIYIKNKRYIVLNADDEELSCSKCKNQSDNFYVNFVALNIGGIILNTLNQRRINMWKIQVTTIWGDEWEDYEDNFITEEAANIRQTELEEAARESGFGEGYRVVPQN